MNDCTMSRRQALACGAVAGAAATGAALGLGQARVAHADTAFDQEYDFVVCGSGTAIFGALAAKAEGAERVLIIEKRGILGGTAGLSTGCFWLPCNYLMDEAGEPDTEEEVVEYLKACAEGQSTDELIEAYPASSRSFAAWTHEHLDLPWMQFGFGDSASWFGGLIYEDFPGQRTGRTLNFDNTAETGSASKDELLGVGGPAMWNFLSGKVDELGIDVMYDTAADHLIVDESGAVVGVVAVDQKSGEEVTIGASQGVLLGTGGFDHNKAWRDAFLRAPIYNSIQVTGNVGDGIRMGMEVGADLANMSSRYGASFWQPFGEEMDPNICNIYDRRYDSERQQRSHPNAIMVNKYGKRFGDESSSYCVFDRAFENWDTAHFEMANLPGYFICDSTFTKYYDLPTATELGVVPDGCLCCDTLEELAEQAGIDYEGLAYEVEKFNGFCETGKDMDFHRGEAVFDVLAGSDDSRDELANKALGPISEPPFYCMPYWPGSLGTSGGLKINAKAQVLDLHGEVIKGLYASGCNSGGIFGAGYPGPGGPIGAGAVMSYVAAMDAVGADLA